MDEAMKMNRTTFHSHCSFCDGRAPMEEFVKSAIEAGFSSYGISSHSPLPFETNCNMFSGDIPDYLAEIERLKKKYSDVIEIYAGLEIDYLDENWNPASKYFRDMPLDYRICSVHLLRLADGTVIDIDMSSSVFNFLVEEFFKGDIRKMIEAYLDASEHAVRTGGFDFVGHANKIAYNAGMNSPGITGQEWYKKRINDYFALIAEKGVMMEINTKAYIAKGCFFPHENYFDLIKELKIPVLVNSDAHRPELVNSGREEALQALIKHGIRTVWELHKGKWEEVEIYYGTR